MEEVRREDKDVMLEAVVLMNYGAALNHLKLYERAIVFHNLAIAKFGIFFILYYTVTIYLIAFKYLLTKLAATACANQACS